MFIALKYCQYEYGFPAINNFGGTLGHWFPYDESQSTQLQNHKKSSFASPLSARDDLSYHLLFKKCKIFQSVFLKKICKGNYKKSKYKVILY